MLDWWAVGFSRPRGQGVLMVRVGGMAPTCRLRSTARLLGPGIIYSTKP